MKTKREAADPKNTGAEKTPAAQEPVRKGPKSEDWTWMVDEDPAFYLNESGTSPSARNG